VITYVDTSALLKLVIDEEGSDRALTMWVTSEVVASVRLVVVEARAALAAAVRLGRLTEPQRRTAVTELHQIVSGMYLVEVTEKLAAGAADVAEAEHLRGYDAVHLAAALTIGAHVFSSADATLCAAAARRGLHVANPLSP